MKSRKDQQQENKRKKLTEKIIKQNQDIIKSQKDAKLKHGDGFSQFTPDEIEEQVIRVNAAFLQRQRDYRAQRLAVVVLHEELKEMSKHIKAYEELYDIKKKESLYKIPMLWEGMEYPINILKAYYDLKHNSYANAYISFNKIQDQLLHDYGLTEKQCEDILFEGKYIQEMPKKELSKDLVDEMKK